MAGRLPFIVGLGAGYVLGTRAGRAQYEKLRSGAAKVMEQPFVRRRVDSVSERVSEAVRAQGEIITDKVADHIKERLFAPRPEAGQANTGAGSAQASPVVVDDAQVKRL